MSEQKGLGTISGFPKLTFVYGECGFTSKTSGMPIECPKCHFDHRPKERESKW